MHFYQNSSIQRYRKGVKGCAGLK